MISHTKSGRAYNLDYNGMEMIRAKAHVNLQTANYSELADVGCALADWGYLRHIDVNDRQEYLLGVMGTLQQVLSDEEIKLFVVWCLGFKRGEEHED